MKKQHADLTGCPVACALDIVGDRWTLLVIRDLMFFNIHEYKDLLASCVGISTNILSERLKRLMDSGLIDAIPHPDSGTRKLYYLTQRGKGLAQTVTHLVRWASIHLHDRVEIPQDKLQMLIERPHLMISKTLEALGEWEQEFGIQQQ